MEPIRDLLGLYCNIKALGGKYGTASVAATLSHVLAASIFEGFIPGRQDIVNASCQDTGHGSEEMVGLPVDQEADVNCDGGLVYRFIWKLHAFPDPCPSFGY